MHQLCAMGSSWRKTSLLLAVLCALHCRLGSSQTGCMDTINISSGGSILTVEGGVQTCFRCLFNDMVNPSTTWTLNSMLISASDGTVTDGVLTTLDPAAVVPSVRPTTLLACIAGSQQYTVFLRRRDLQPPNINSSSVTIVSEGDDLTLTCNHLNSFPVEQFYWRTANGSIVTGIVNLALMLRFTDILCSSSGNYTCTVQDDRSNTASSTITIIVQCAPRPLLTAPTTANITNTSVNVSWESPGGCVDFYNIQYKLSSVEWTSPDDVRDISVMGFDTSVSINGLLPNITYDLRIRTRNVNGESEWSPEATFTTRCAPRPLLTAPTTANITNTSVNVSWESPGGCVDFYNIQYKLSSVEWTSPDDVRDISVMGFDTSVSINGLLPNITYDLRIRTRNVNGESEWSPEATFTTRSPPPAVHIDGPSAITTGQTVVLVCNVSRDVMVIWSRDNGRPLPNTPDGNMLRIEMPQAEDGGAYRCSAGGVVATFNLVVMEPPTTATTPPATIALPGLSPGAIAGIAVGTIIGLVLIVGFLLLIFLLVTGKVRKHKSPAAPPDTTEISFHGNTTNEGYNHKQDLSDELDEHKA